MTEQYLKGVEGCLFHQELYIGQQESMWQWTIKLWEIVKTMMTQQREETKAAQETKSKR